MGAAARCPRWAWALSPLRLLQFVRSLYQTLGLRLCLMLLSVFFGLKGLLDSVTLESLLPLFRELGFDGVAYQRTLAIALTPYALKGFIGSVSDSWPLWGFHKKHYMLLSNVVGLCCAAALLLLPQQLQRSSIVYVGLLFCGIHLHIATADLLCEGVYCKLVKAKPSIGAKLVAFLSFCNSMGHLVGKTLVGPISDKYGTRPLLYITLPLVLQTLLPISLNFLGEPRADPAARCCSCSSSSSCSAAAAPVAGVRSRRGVFVVAALTSLCACVGLVLTLQAWRGWALVFTLSVLLLLGAAALLLLQQQLALCALFFFADRVLHLTISGAVNFFYIAPASCVPQGPQFDYTYFCTYTALVGALGCWFGIFAFQKWLKSWSAHNIFWLTNSVRIAAALFDYVMVRRLNLLLGIPDKLMFLLGDSIVYHLLLTLSCMTSSLTIARSCPSRLEATVYAIVSGVTSLGSTCSKMLGAVAIELAQIRMKEELPGGCDFSNLPNLILLSQCLLPVACIPLAYLMLPREPLNSPVPVLQRRGKPAAPPEEPAAAEQQQQQQQQQQQLAAADSASETLALQEAVVGDREDQLAVYGTKNESRPRIVEV